MSAVGSTFFFIQAFTAIQFPLTIVLAAFPKLGMCIFIHLKVFSNFSSDFFFDSFVI